MWNKCKAILLASNQDSELFIGDLSKQLHYNFSIEKGNSVNQHLYITSEDEIKEGDYGLHLNNKDIIQFTKVLFKECDLNLYKKIIATTNTSLKVGKNYGSIEIDNKIIDCNDYLPQPSQQFIEKYIEEYNKGNIISGVLVEYDCDHNQMSNKVIDILKVNQDNTINIKTAKDSFSREDMIKFAWWFVRNTGQYSDDRTAHLEGKYLDEYLQNL